MELIDVIKSRRSIRSFSDSEVPRRSIEYCLNAARLAPSGSNAQPWRFLVVRNPETRARLAEAGFNQPCLEEAPVVTVLLGDRGLYRKRLRRAKELNDIGAISDETVTRIQARYEKHSEGKENNDVNIAANCMLAGDHYVLAAASLGLGTCWMMLFDKEKAATAIGLDEKNNFVVALIPTGFPKEEDIAPRPRYGLSKVAMEETMDSPWREGEE